VPWLSVATAGTTVTATISTTADAPSTRDGIIAVYAERASGSIRQVAVPVSFTLGPAMVLNPTVLAFEAAAGDSAAPMPDTRSFTIDGSNLDWTASSNQDWLVLGQTSGNAPGTIDFTVDHSGLPGGEHAALISVHDAFSDRTRTIGVTLLVKAAQLVLNPAQATFVIDAASTAADLTQAVSVGDDAVGDDPISWSVTSVSAPWLEAAPASGSSRPAAELTLSLDTSQFTAVGNGVHDATVTLAYSDAGGTPQTRVVNVQLDLNIPHVDAVMPYLGIVDVAGNVVLHGEGLGTLTADQVTVGGVTPTSFDVLSDKAVRLGLPGFAAGTYEIEIPDNTLGQDFSTARLEVIAAQERPYAVFPLDHHAVTGRLLFDDERETLYVADLTLPGVSRYRHAMGAWTELPAFEIPQIRDIALSHDGSTLHILADRQIYALDLDDPLATPETVHTNTAYPDSPWLYLKMAIAGDTALISSQYCCAFTWEPGSSVTQIVQPPISASSLVLGSGDGSRVYLPASTMHRYSAATGQFTALQSSYDVTAVNQDGSRLMNFNWVMDDDLTVVGLVRKRWMYGVFARRSDRIYAFRAEYTDLDSGLNVYVVDPTGTPDADNVLPEIRRIAIPGPDIPYTAMDAINSPTAVSADGRTFFIQGQDKLLIVPTGD
jgi:hypothetical protein